MDGSAATTYNSSNDELTVDPLLEQMRSVLRLGPRASDSYQRRFRRFSDADRPSEELPSRVEPMAVRSRDGTRWLPCPDEQSLRYGQKRTDSRTDEPELSQALALENHICNSAICAVSRVFETTELLELIVSFLDTRDIINLRRTNRQWNDTICESPQLRLHFFTYGEWARPGAQFQILPLSLPGLSIELGDELHLGRWIIVSLTPKAAKRISPNPPPSRRIRARSIFEGLRGGLGSRPHGSNDMWPVSRSTPTTNSTVQYEELLVTQPPVLGMQAFIVYSSNELEDKSATAVEGESLDDDLRACAKLSCDAGITLGFLAETAQSLLNSQKAGPSNSKDVRVVFKTIMSFCSAETAPKKRSGTKTVTPIP